MTLAFISDIHGNRVYLDAVAGQLAGHRPDVIYCLGDLVGYYDEPGAVIDWCREHGVVCVKGNHDKYVLGEIAPNQEREHLYRSRAHAEALNDEQREFLRGVPDSMSVEHAGKSFYLTHSLPGDVEGYLRDVDALDRDFLRSFDYYCHGHTHIPMIRYHYGTAVLNPGSVGQPRDFSRQPSFALVDLDSNAVSLHKLNVDYESYSRSLLEKGFSPKTVELLRRTMR